MKRFAQGKNRPHLLSFCVKVCVWQVKEVSKD